MLTDVHRLIRDVSSSARAVLSNAGAIVSFLEPAFFSYLPTARVTFDRELDREASIVSNDLNRASFADRSIVSSQLHSGNPRKVFSIPFFSLSLSLSLSLLPLSRARTSDRRSAELLSAVATFRPTVHGIPVIL